jgi:hypothetical protein
MIIFSALAVALAGAVPGAAPADAARLEGEWTCQSARVGGRVIAAEVGMRWRFFLRKDLPGDVGANLFTLHREVVPPLLGHIDWLIDYVTIDPATNPKRLDVTNMRRGGIYRFTGDRLEICFNWNEGPPTDFSAEKGTLQKLYVLVRKPAAKQGAGGGKRDRSD